MRADALEAPVGHSQQVAGDGVAIERHAVARLHHRAAQLPQAAVTPDGEQRRIEQRVVLAQVLLLLRPTRHTITSLTI